jgi:DNA-binding NarL/FixJ family response regulator
VGQLPRKELKMTRVRILVADDSKLMCDKIVHLLEPEFEVLAAVGDGPALLEAATRLKPDVCVLDISMPTMSGIETAAKLRQRGSHARVIFLTIHDDLDFVGAAFKSGAEGYVIKPRMAADLCVAVREVLAGRTFVSSFGS